MESIILKKIWGFFVSLNYWYENSYTFKVLSYVVDLFKTSLFFSPIYRAFTKEDTRDYLPYSILNIPIKIAGIFFYNFKKFFLYLIKINEGSLNQKIFSFIWIGISKKERAINSFILALCGIFFVNIFSNFSIVYILFFIIFAILSFINSAFLIQTAKKSFIGFMINWLGNNESILNKQANFENKNIFIHKILFFIFGILIGIIGFFTNILFSLALLFGISFVFFSYFYLSLSFGFFIFFVTIVPDIIWSNLFIFFAFVFYSCMYILHYFLGKNEGINKKYLLVSILLYIFFSIISFFTGFGGMDSVRVAIIMFSSIGLGLLATNIINTKQELNNIVFIMLVALVLAALYGLFQFHTGIEIRADFVDIMANAGMPGRLYSTMGNPNNFAKFLTMLLPFGVAYFFVSEGKIKKIFILSMIAIVFVSLLLTFSRASYLSIIGIGFIYVILVKPRLIPVAIFILIISIPFIPQVILNRISTIGTDSSSLYRVFIWEGSLRTLISYWSSGIGIGPRAFNMIYRNYSHNMAGNAMHAHNVFFNVWIEIGIGGFLAILAYNFSLFKMGISSFWKERGTHKHYLVAGIASLFGFIMFSMVEHVWFYPRTMLAYFLMTGILLACVKITYGERAI
ncbi:MAG: O-antigen ligase family protein [Defluviitaleaceae bacterium]|nr:O-antigen ligase family protein [Defluviitaleaceae bacterium]